MSAAAIQMTMSNHQDSLQPISPATAMLTIASPARATKGRTALMDASRKGDLPELARLLPSSDVFATDAKGRSALMHALQGFEEPQAGSAANLILAAERLRRTGNHAETAARTGHAMQKAASLGLDGFVQACAQSLLNDVLDDELLQGMLEKALFSAAGAGSMACCRIMIDAGATGAWRDDRGHGAAMKAVEAQSLECLLAIAETGKSRLAEPNRAGITPLMIAARRGRVDLIQALLPSGGAKQRSSGGESALARAAARDALECMQALLPHSNAGARDRQGGTALMRCASRGFLPGVLLLASMDGARSVDRQGNDAFMIAMQRGHQDCAKALLSTSTPGMVNRDGLNAFDFAHTPELMALAVESFLTGAQSTHSEQARAKRMWKKALDRRPQDERALASAHFHAAFERLALDLASAPDGKPCQPRAAKRRL